jgi:hypothetical protein
MKHLLNDLSEQEKNSIREQHTGGMKVMTENFSRLLKSKSGDVKTLVAEQASISNMVGQASGLGSLGNAIEISNEVGNFMAQTLPITTIYNMIKSAVKGDAKTFSDALDKESQRLGPHYQTLKNAVTKGDISKNLQGIATVLNNVTKPIVSQLSAGMGNQSSTPTPPAPSVGGVQPINGKTV